MIGSATCKKLVDVGHEIVVVSRNSKKSKLMCPFPAEHISWVQLAEINSKKIDTVIHLAGESVASGVWTKKVRERIASSRVETAKALKKMFLDAGYWPKLWINASAIGLYSDDHSGVVLTEESASGAGFLASVVKQWEASISDLPESIRIVKLRLGIVLSARSGALASMLPVFRGGLGGRLGSGKQLMSWIHIDDVVDMIEFAVRSTEVKGAYNAVAPNPVTNSEFTNELGAVLGRPTFAVVPKFVLELLGEASRLLLGSQNVSSAKIQAHGFRFSFPDLSSALKNLLDFHSRWGVHEVFCEQWIPQKVDEVFPFFCDEKNLERLTPEILNFHVIGKSTEVIEEGTLIDYRLKIRGVPAKWRTKILDWVPNEKFVDTQLKGPYALWHHTHEFRPLGGGTLLTDRVLFKIPVWPLSNAAFPLIKSDVETIFKFRQAKIFELFGAKKP
jgi:uncharacterized protein (TIGR01777 family)